MRWLRRILAIILVVLAIIFFIIAVICYIMAATFLTLSYGVWLALGVGALALAYMSDQETASRYTKRAIDAVGDVVSGAGKVLGKATGSLIGGLWSSLPVALKVAILGLGGYFVYRIVKTDDGDEIIVRTPRQKYDTSDDLAYDTEFQDSSYIEISEEESNANTIFSKERRLDANSQGGNYRGVNVDS